MPVLTPDQIGALIYANGKWGPGGDKAKVEKFLDTAIAVCLAESGGDTDAKNPSSSASGLWQIMVSAHGDKIKGRNIFDPKVNTDVARQVWEEAGNSWSPWRTYTNGDYKQYLGHGKPVYAKLEKSLKDDSTGRGILNMLGTSFLFNPVTAPLGVAEKVVAKDNPLTGGVSGVVAGALKDTFKYLSKMFLTIWAATGALVLVAIGVWFLVSQSETGAKLKASATDAAMLAATKGAV